MRSKHVADDAGDVVAVAGEDDGFVAETGGRDLSNKRVAMNAVRVIRDATMCIETYQTGPTVMS